MRGKERSLKRSFEAYLKQAEEASFSGWDFSYVYGTGRMTETPLRWNYYTEVMPYLRQAETMLDMGTGGGEMLARFQPLPPTTYATEQYHPNVAVAKKRLEPLGVKVFEIAEEKEPPFNRDLPFDDEFFDLVINRHEAYYPPELMRILKPGGSFITQQVGSLTNVNLVQFFLDFGIDIGRRLIEQQDVRFTHEGPCYQNTLTLPSGQIRKRMPVEVQKPYLLESRPGGLFFRF